MADLFSLAGHRAFVTGANTGIGQAIAVALASQGADVTCAGRRPCDETIAMITAAGGRADAALIDFADPMAAREVFAGADYTLLVNNAGIIRRADAVDHSEADWDAVIDTNLKAVFFTCQAFGRELIASGQEGSIVNIASLLSLQGGIRVPGYTASKHGVAGLTKLLANEWAPHGITVNAIAPAISPRTTPRRCARTPTARGRSWNASPPVGGGAPRISAARRPSCVRGRRDT